MKKHQSQKLMGRKNVYILITTFIGLAGVSVALWSLTNSTTGPQVVVYKSPTCQCCNKWIAHLEQNGFKVTAKNTRNVKSIKEKYGIKHNFSACHTAVIAGYFVEGHVPAQSIHRLLSEKPDIKGITVPGMPIGSPGMEQGTRKQPYNVLAIDVDGSTAIYESYRN